MNRRNFVVGLGTVATVSGVASVTAASFANSATAQADFRVVVDEELIVRQGEGYEASLDQYASAEITDDEDDDNPSFTDVDEDNPALAFVNEEENDALESQLALLNDPDADLEELFDDIYEVVNDGSTEQEVGITFDFGDDVENNDEIDEQDVIDLYTFTAPDGTEISQNEPDSGPANTLAVASGETEQINLELDLNDNLVQTFTDAADGDPFDSGGAADTLDLLDNINVGVEFDDSE